MISGFVFKRKEHLFFIINKAKRILVPYLFFSIIAYIAYYASNYNQLKIPIRDFFIGTFLGISNDYYLSWNIVLWFLPSLFLINVLYNSIPKKIEFILILFWIIGFYFSYTTNSVFPFHLKSTLLAIPFFSMGILIKKNYKKIEFVFQNNPILKSSLILIIASILTFLNPVTPDLRLSIIGNPIIFYFSAIFISLSLLILCKKINIPFIVWLGINSLIIMGLHLKLRFIAIKVVSLIPLIKGDILKNLLISILILLMLAIPIFILNKYFPHLVGRSKY